MAIGWQGVFPALMTEFSEDGALDRSRAVVIDLPAAGTAATRV